jgi:uncharacterized protein YjbI with pentapeptide repeats
MTRALARSSGEMSFFASLHSCPACGTRVDPDVLTIYGADNAWALTGRCSQCRGPLIFKFQTDGNPIQGIREFGQLGVGHSAILSPKQFIVEIERLSPGIELDPTKLSIGPWKQNRDTNDRVNVCLAELAKFFPPGTDAIPTELLGPDDLADRAARPDRYHRPWVAGLIERHQQVVASLIADLPRIQAIDTARTAKRTKGIDYLEREHLVAHEKWVHRGKKGKGRLVLVDALHVGMKVGRGVELAGARLDNVNLTEAYLEDANLVDAELDNVRLDRAHLYGSMLHRARLTSGSFDGADLKQVEFNDARIVGSQFDRTTLDHSSWRGAMVTDASFTACTLGNASLDGATFTRCNFSGSDLSAPEPRRPPATRARFEACDLSNTNWQGRDLTGARFIKCKFAGAKGQPAHIDGMVIEDPDSLEIMALWRVRS